MTDNKTLSQDEITRLIEFDVSDGVEARREADEVAEMEDVAINRDDIEDRMRIDFNFMAAVAMPESFIYMWPMMYLACFQLIQDLASRTRDFTKLALGFPRGFAKTTFVKLCVLWIILFTKKRFILILAANEQLAKNFVSDVADFLDSTNIQGIFGYWKIAIEKDVEGYKKFTYRGRSIILAGLGAGSSLRGIVVKNQRPDVMIFDDVQTKEQAESKTESDALERWFFGTALKAKSPHGCLFLFLANMYPTEHSLLRKLKKNSTWVKFITGAILSDGKSLWEELQPLEQLLDEYKADTEAGHPEIFLAEVMNDENIQNNNLLDVTRVKLNPYELMVPAPIPHGKAIIIDPALDKKTSDLVSIGYHEYFNRAGSEAIDDVVTDLVEGRFSPGEIIKEALLLGIRNNCRLIVCEGGGFQATLIYWFNQVCTSLQLEGFMFREITTGNRSKNSRVFKLFKELHSGDVILHSRIRAGILAQGCDYNPTKTDNTDGALDVSAYGPDVLAKYPGEILAVDSLLGLESNNLEVIEDNSLF